MRPLIPLVLLFFVAGCDSDSPTAPGNTPPPPLLMDAAELVVAPRVVRVCCDPSAPFPQDLATVMIRPANPDVRVSLFELLAGNPIPILSDTEVGPDSITVTIRATDCNFSSATLELDVTDKNEEAEDSFIEILVINKAVDPTATDANEAVRALEEATTSYLGGVSLSGDTQPPVYMTVAGNNGWTIIDAADGSEVVGDFVSKQPNPAGATFGAVAMSEAGRHAVFAHGAWGASIVHDDGKGGFGAETVVENGNITDGSRYPGGLVYVDNANNFIGFVQHDAKSGLFQLTSSVIAAKDFPGASGNVVSAFRPAAPGPVLFVTDGDPGELWIKDPDVAGPATKVSDVGSFPRRVRCLDGFCVVTSVGTALGFAFLNFFDEGPAGVYSSGGGLTVAKSPVGIDLKRLEDGGMALLFTAFGANEYRIMATNADGDFVADDTFALPPECTGPGHAAWLPGPGCRFVVSCNTSSNVFTWAYAPTGEK